MAGYTLKRFSGRVDKDIDEFIKDYRLYLTVVNITTANADSKQKALKLFQSYLTDEASSNMTAVVALNNANIMVTMINVSDDTLLLALLTGVTSITVISAHNVHMDENWFLTRECSVDASIATNASNKVLNNNNNIVLPNIKLVRSSISLKKIILQLFKSNRN
ncbi:5143_t:CDS:2 [Funneliformis caledonium]|uniref:5143_t:CDS:1 n=1 Tax=Funneliformis caledonium TaxID=1117310 RepID=A0A9N9D068_9GLOM|nr:5143_t:CDS:2 [Funneliformis caledonium]